MKQIILEDLPLEERIKYIESIKKKLENSKSMVSNLQYGGNRYEITQEADLVVLGKSITHTITKTEWQISYKLNNRIEASLVVSREAQESGGGWDELLSLMNKLTVPLKKIDFELSTDGYIINILNSNEILSTWNNIKLEFANDENFIEILKLGDKDYSNPLQTIKKNILYQLFFFSLYKTETDYELNKAKKIKVDIPIQSIIFPEYALNGYIEEIAYEKSGDYVFFNQNTITKNIELEKLQQLYKVRYKDFIDQASNKNYSVENYSISYKSNYKISSLSNKLHHCKAIFEEKIHNDLFYKSNIEIKLIEE